MKKILSVFLAALMLLTIVPVAFAATPTITTTVDKTSVAVGDVITLTAKVSANSKLCALTYEITYDASAFEVVENSASSNGVFGGNESFNTSKSGIVRYLGASSSSVGNASQTFFTIKFKALKSSGTISVAVVEAYITDGGIDETNVTSAVNSASAKSFAFAGSSVGYYISIGNTSRNEIRYKDGIILHAVSNRELPAGATIKWKPSNGNFKTTESADGRTYQIVAESNGDTEFTATLYDSKGNPIESVVITMTSKAGFFDKIIGFFLDLFGATKIYPN